MCHGMFRSGYSGRSGVSGAVFLVGLAFLFFSGMFWPGILALIGLVSMTDHLTGRGEGKADLSGAVFMVGLAILFFTGWFWPGILVLVGVTALVGHSSKQDKWFPAQSLTMPKTEHTAPLEATVLNPPAEMTAVKCRSCGASSAVPVRSGSATCRYCGSHLNAVLTA